MKKNSGEDFAEYLQSLCEYTYYSLISLGNTIFKKHLENLSRFEKVVVNLGMYPNDILIIE